MEFFKPLGSYQELNGKGSITNGGNIDIPLFDKTVYQSAKIAISIEDSTRNNISHYEYIWSYVSLMSVPYNRMFFDAIGEIQNINVSYSFLGDVFQMQITNNSGGTLYYTYQILYKLPLAQ